MGVFSVESGGDRPSGVARGVFRSMSEMGVRIWVRGGGGGMLPRMESEKKSFIKTMTKFLFVSRGVFFPQKFVV